MWASSSQKQKHAQDSWKHSMGLEIPPPLIKTPTHICQVDGGRLNIIVNEGKKLREKNYQHHCYHQEPHDQPPGALASAVASAPSGCRSPSSIRRTRGTVGEPACGAPPGQKNKEQANGVIKNRGKQKCWSWKGFEGAFRKKMWKKIIRAFGGVFLNHRYCLGGKYKKNSNFWRKKSIGGLNVSENAALKSLPVPEFTKIYIQFQTDNVEAQWRGKNNVVNYSDEIQGLEKQNLTHKHKHKHKVLVNINWCVEPLQFQTVLLLFLGTTENNKSITNKFWRYNHT